MIGCHETTWINAEKVERVVFASADGRILGSENVYRQREVCWDGQVVKSVSGEPSATERFYDIAEAGAWLEALRCREQVVRVQLAGGTKLVFAR